MKKVAVIDIGSNSIRLVLVAISEKNSFRTIDDQKVSARLGDELSKNGYIKKERFDLALHTLKLFKNLIDIHHIKDVLCVGTAALRRASNGPLFVKKVKELYDIEIDVISGEKEAFYDYCAVVNSFDIKDGVLIDIGGGSSEIAMFVNRELKHCVSLPYGAIDIAQMFNLKSKVSAKDKKKLLQFYQNLFSEIEWLKEAQGLPLIGVGGSTRNIAKIDQQRINHPLETAHNYIMEPKKVEQICQNLQEMSLKKRKSVPGLSKSRADIIVGASSLVNVLLKELDSPFFATSGFGIRDGLIYNYLLPKGKHIVGDVLEFSLLNALNNFGSSLIHCTHIDYLADQLFLQLHSLHQIPDEYLNTLKAACYLHDIGMFIQYYDHHDHTFYMMLNSRITGLTHRELIMSAFIAANHRDKKCSTCDSKYLTIISKAELQILEYLYLIMKLAEGLDRSQVGIIKKINCKISKKSVTILVDSDDDPTIEIETALNFKKLFKKLFDKNLIIKS